MHIDQNLSESLQIWRMEAKALRKTQTAHMIGKSYTEGLEISYDVNVEDFSESGKIDEVVGKDDLTIDSRGKDVKHGEEIARNVEDLEISYNDKMESSFQNLHHCTESLRGTELFRENQMQISVVHGKDMEEGKALKGLDWIEPRHQHASVEEDEIAVLAAKFSIFHGDAVGVSSSNTCDENKVLCESQKEVLEQSFSLPKSFSVNEDTRTGLCTYEYNCISSCQSKNIRAGDDSFAFVFQQRFYIVYQIESS